MNPIDRLIKTFSEFPGVGPRQAARFVYFLLAKGPAFTSELSRTVSDLQREIRMCESCMRYFKSATNTAVCTICANEHRDKTVLTIVPYDTDLTQIEKSNQFDGQYFVLGGIVPILEKEPERRIRQEELLKKLSKNTSDLKEIIIATSANPDGEHTTEYLVTLLSPFAKKNNIAISTFGRGFSTGTEIEYSDPETIKYALKNRSSLG